MLLSRPHILDVDLDRSRISVCRRYERLIRLLQGKTMRDERLQVNDFVL